MKRIACLAIAALSASLLVGCTSSKKDDAAAASEQKYKLLNGLADSSSTSGKDAFDRGSAPQIQPNTFFAAGQLSESEGHADCAVVQYQQALRLDPKHVPSLYRMGVMLTKEKKYEEAVAVWKRYIDATGKVASGYSNLGFTYEMASDVPSAEAAYKQGIEIDAKNNSCRINYGLMLARQNRSDEAKEQLATVLSPAEVSYNLASIYEQQGAMARAKEELQNALTENPNMTEAQQKLASLPQD